MSDSPSSEVKQEENSKPYHNDVYAATPSSGSGGGEEEEEVRDDRKVNDEKIQHMESIQNYLQTPDQGSNEKVNEWVTQTSNYSADNPVEAEEPLENANKSENMELDETIERAEPADGNQEESEESLKTFKIFVSNLPPGLLDSELMELFQTHGEVVECEIFAKSYAFVHMTSEEAGMKALEQLNGLEIRGCKINVKRSVQNSLKAKPKAEPEPEPEPEPMIGLEVGTFKIYIGNMQEDVTKEDVETLLAPFGRTVEIEIYRNNSAFVHMETEEDGTKAIEQLNGHLIPDSEKPLKVSVSNNPKGPSLPTIKLMVKNVAKTVLAEELRNLFTPYGLVLKVVISVPPRSKKRTNEYRTAIVHLEQFGNIRSAIKDLSGKEVGGVPIKVEAYFDKPEKSKPKPKPSLAKSTNNLYNRPAPRPLLADEENPFEWPQANVSPEFPQYTEPIERGPPSKMRLIPMPSEADLHKFPKSSKGRRLLKPVGPPPTPLMDLFDAPRTPWGRNNNSPWGGNNNSPWEGNDTYQNKSPWGGNDSYQHDSSWGMNNAYSNEHGYEEAINDGFGGGYSNYDESEDYNQFEEFDYSQYTEGNDYAVPPPSKIPRNKSRGNFRNPTGKSMQQQKNGRGKQYNNNSGFNNRGNKGLFPQMPRNEEFPRVPQSLMSVQIPPKSEQDCDWSSDLPVSNFSEFSNNQFESNEHASAALSAVPFDYSQIRKKKNFPPKQQYNSNANMYGNSQNFQAKQSSSGKSRKGNKGKSRRPGLGTSQQQKKIAHQTGTDEGETYSGQPGEWQPVSSGTTPDASASSDSSAYAPYYFQQNWSFSKGKQNNGNKRPTPKQIKEAEEEQKRQYSEYLKEKPWLYQAIPGTVKKVNHI